jgi:5'-3' exonuclease
VTIHLIDGTYELFRQFYGARRFNDGVDKPLGAVNGVLHSILQMIDKGATHIGVATDHVIESFRNDLWPGYKTATGMEPNLTNQFHPLEDALKAMGVACWPMVELECDDGLASAACIAENDPRVDQVCIWSPDKDLSQCVIGNRVVVIDRRNDAIRGEEGVIEKFGVPPKYIPDLLALVGDAADGYPGIPKIGKVTAAKLINKYGPIEDFPPEVLGENRANALLFKHLATLNCEAQLFDDVEELRWKGATDAFTPWAVKMGDERIIERAEKARLSLSQ